MICLCGCAGTGTGTGGTGANPANNVRPNVTGDMFNYSVTGTYRATPTSLSVATTGTATEAFQANTYNGQAALESTVTTILALASGSQTFIESEQLSGTGVTLGVTDAGTLQAVTTGGFTKPSTLTTTTSISGTETLANGKMVALLYTVTGAVNITTKAGTFACWTVTRSITYSDGFSSNDTIEFAPSIGAAVQEVVHNSYSNGFSDILTASLTSYSFGGT